MEFTEREMVLVEAAVAHLVGLSQGVEDSLRHDLAFEAVYGAPDKADGIKQDLGEQSVVTADWVRLLAKVRGK